MVFVVNDIFSKHVPFRLAMQVGYKTFLCTINAFSVSTPHKFAVTIILLKIFHRLIHRLNWQELQDQSYKKIRRGVWNPRRSTKAEFLTCLLKRKFLMESTE